jgi:hypothetical protein
LKPVVRDYFERVSLSTDRLRRLESLAADRTPAPAGWRRRLAGPRFGWSIAAALAVALVLLILVPQERTTDRTPLTERIALEVARNHIKLKPLDVVTHDMDDIRRYFTDLEFVPVSSALLATADLALQGGRYCSIRGIPAAQLRLIGPHADRPETLYETEYRRDVFGPLPVLENGDSPVTVNVRGIRVHIWVEKGLLFALAENTGVEPVIPRR